MYSLEELLLTTSRRLEWTSKGSGNPMAAWGMGPIATTVAYIKEAELDI